MEVEHRDVNFFSCPLVSGTGGLLEACEAHIFFPGYGSDLISLREWILRNRH
jgi:hypothetical protein